MKKKWIEKGEERKWAENGNFENTVFVSRCFMKPENSRKLTLWERLRAYCLLSLYSELKRHTEIHKLSDSHQN